jgi:hypothetical protein
MKSVLVALILFLSIIVFAVMYDSMIVPVNPSGGPAGSVVFSTSKDASITSSSDLMNSGTNDFTLELFYKATMASITSSATLISLNSDAVGNPILTQAFLFKDLNGVYLRFAVMGTVYLSFEITEKLNDWHHLAIVYSGPTISWFYDGVLIGSQVLTQPFNINYALDVPYVEIGYCTNSSQNYFVGNIANVRYSTKAQYTIPFTIPSVPLSAVDTGTLLLFTDQANLLTDSSDSIGTIVEQRGGSSTMVVADVTISF